MFKRLLPYLKPVWFRYVIALLCMSGVAAISTGFGFLEWVFGALDAPDGITGVARVASDAVQGLPIGQALFNIHVLIHRDHKGRSDLQSRHLNYSGGPGSLGKLVKSGPP